MQKIAIISDKPGWHGEQLRLALSKQGCQSTFVPLQHCSLNLDTNSAGVSLPGFERTLPDGVFVRGIPAGTLQEITFWLDILHALHELGVPVYNHARGIERSVDKAMTSFLLHQADIPTPPCWVFHTRDNAKVLVKREHAKGFELVFKPLFGSQGEGLKRITQPEQLPDPGTASGIYYLQRFIETEGEYCFDWRVFVIGGRAVATMQRQASGWITNVANGADCLSAILSKPLMNLAEQAIKRLDLSYGGVDIICDTEGKYQVIEVNSIPAWKGLQSVCSFDISELLIKDFLGFCNNTRPIEVVNK